MGALFAGQGVGFGWFYYCGCCTSVVFIHAPVHVAYLAAVCQRLLNTACDALPCSWDTPFPLIHERFYIPDYLRVFEGIKATIEY